MTTSWQSRTFGSVGIDWRADPPAAFDVKVWWLDSLIVAATIGAAEPRLPFSARTEDDDQHVAGLLEVRGGPGVMSELVLRWLRYPGGEVRDVVLWPSEPPPPLPPRPGDDPPPEEIEAIVDGEGEHDLFPYVYVRPWPSPSEDELVDRFVAYEGTCGDGSDTLYCRLVQAHTDRAAMEREAVSFIEGRSPFAGQFLGRIDRLVGPIAAFGSVDAELRQRPVVTLGELKGALERRLSMTWDAIVAYVTTDPVFAEQLDRAWQNLFALVIVLGYDRELLDAVIRTVVMARLVERIAASALVGGGEAAWPAPKVRDGVHATVVLPEAIFPLPPASPQPIVAASAIAKAGEAVPAPEPIRAYAIGDLQLVRQRLVRYELGEVSAIENVMRGESKRTTRRTLSRRAETSAEESTAEQASSTALLGTRAELLAELGRTLAAEFAVDEKTNYGPPTEGTAVSSITVGANPDGKPQLDLQERASQFARAVTARTAGRMSRAVRRGRVVSTLDEAEATVVTRLDGTRGPARGIYRWVNKVYQAHVVHYGRRLILEALIKDPARVYISSEQSLQGVSLTTPTSLAELGVRSFRDISRDPLAPGYYAALAARYGARDLTPPPPAVETTGAAFQAGVDVHVRELVVPEGYRARRAYVTASWMAGAPPSEVFGVVGREPFRIASTASAQTVTLALGAEGAAIPVAFGCRPLPEVQPDEAARAVEGCLATIEIEAELGERSYEEWQIRTYDVLAAAFQRQRDAYLGGAGAAPASTATRNPLSSREVVRQQLQQDVMRELQRLVVRRTGERDEVVIGAPRYAQFFEQAFEWREMAFSFTVQTGDTPESRALARYAGDDQLFTAFLQASFARVLLPVRPGHDFAVPYLLASGMLWDGPDALAPANRGSVALINDLKTAESRPPEREVRSAPWEIHVPTAMVMLQDGPDLPGLVARRAR